VAILVLLGPRVHAETGARETVQRLYDALAEVVKDAEALGFEGRFQRLAPVLIEVYDFPAMTRFATGPAWAEASEEQRLDVVAAFRDMSIATYARRFDGGGARFDVMDERELGVDDILVRTTLTPGDGSEAIELDYRVRAADGVWRIIDVYLTGTVSELATRRAEFAPIIRDQGLDGLIKALREKASP
jgi:phospholipid transport system substrate-binding protein